MPRRPNIEGMDPQARRELLLLIEKAKDRGIPATVTSAHRTREEQKYLYEQFLAGKAGIQKAAPPGSSKHETGLAVDVSVPKQHRKAFNELASAHGYKWYGPGDAVHYSYVGSAAPFKPPGKPQPQGFDAVFAQPDKPKAKGFDEVFGGTAAKPKAQGFDAVFGTQPKPAPAKPRPVAQKPTAPSQAATLAGAALKGGLDPFGILGAMAPAASWAGQQLGRPAAGLTAAFNELERQAQIRRSKPGYKPILGFIDPTLNISGDISAALAAGKQAFQSGGQPEVSFLRQWAGMGPGKTNPTLYGAVTAAEQMLPFLYDPLNVAMPTALAGAGRLAPKLQKVAGRIPQVRAAQKGQEITETIIQPTMRHKEDIQAIVRESNLKLRALRKANPALDKAIQQSGQNPLYDLAAQMAKADPAQRGAILASAKAQGIPPGLAKQTSEALARNADETYAALQQSGHAVGKYSKEEFLEGFFALGKDGTPQGLHWARQARRGLMLNAVAPVASDGPGPGLVKVPEIRDEVTGIPLYGKAAGKYLPKTAVARLKDIVEEAEKVPDWLAKPVRMAKNMYLALPWTPVKNLVQNAGGIGMLMQKVGGSMLDVIPHAKSTATELWQFWTTGKLSPMMKEFSDIDPSFLQALRDVKVADGTAGRFIRVGGKTIPLPTTRGLFSATEGLLTPTSSEHVFLKANGGVDQIGKLAAYKTLRARGIPPDRAVKAVNRHVVSYGNLPPDVGKWVANLDRSGVWTFANVPVQLAITAAHTAVTRPDLLARPGQLQQRMLKAFGAQEAYERDVPEAKKSPFVLPHPTKPGAFIDYAALSPLAEPYKMARGLAGMADVPPGPTDIQRAIEERSILGPWLALRDPQKRIVPEGATPSEQWRLAQKHVVDTYSPLGRFAGQMAQAGQGQGISRDPFAPPETREELIAKALGFRPVKTGTRAEQREAGAGRVEAIMDVTGKTLDEEFEVAEKSMATNRYRARAGRGFTPEQAGWKAREVREDIQKRLLTEDSFVANGKITDEGRRQIRDAVQWFLALVERAEQER